MGDERSWHDLVLSTLRKVLAYSNAAVHGIDVLIELHFMEMAEDSATETGLLQELVE